MQESSGREEERGVKARRLSHRLAKKDVWGCALKTRGKKRGRKAESGMQLRTDPTGGGGQGPSDLWGKDRETSGELFGRAAGAKRREEN